MNKHEMLEKPVAPNEQIERRTNEERSEPMQDENEASERKEQLIADTKIQELTDNEKIEAIRKKLQGESPDKSSEANADFMTGLSKARSIGRVEYLSELTARHLRNTRSDLKNLDQFDIRKKLAKELLTPEEQAQDDYDGLDRLINEKLADMALEGIEKGEIVHDLALHERFIKSEENNLAHQRDEQAREYLKRTDNDMRPETKQDADERFYMEEMSENRKKAVEKVVDRNTRYDHGKLDQEELEKVQEEFEKKGETRMDDLEYRMWTNKFKQVSQRSWEPDESNPIRPEILEKLKKEVVLRGDKNKYHIE